MMNLHERKEQDSCTPGGFLSRKDLTLSIGKSLFSTVDRLTSKEGRKLDPATS